MENSEFDKQPVEKRYLTGSRGGDSFGGFIAGIAWWGLGWMIVSQVAMRNRDSVIAILVILFLIESLVIFTRPSLSSRFVVWQLLTAGLLPLICVGLFFGACLLMVGGHGI